MAERVGIERSFLRADPQQRGQRDRRTGLGLLPMAGRAPPGWAALSTELNRRASVLGSCLVGGELLSFQNFLDDFGFMLAERKSPRRLGNASC